jgi:outer membrane protein TolC
MKTQMALYDRTQSYLVAQANENLRGSEIDVARKQDDIIFQVATLFLDAEQAARSLDAARREMDSLTRVRDLIKERVAEGRELPIESKKAELAARRAQLNLDALATNLINAEISLAQVLGLAPDDRVRAALEERTGVTLPGSEEQTIEQAIEYSRDIKRIESNMQSKMLEIKSYRAMRLPKINLVAQYSLFAKYNYQDYFTRFQRNNGQLGASFEIPLLVGHAARAYASQGEVDMAKFRIDLDRTRARIAGDVRRAFQEVKRSESAREVARLELDVARDQVAINLAQMDEGRLPLAAVEQARAMENDKWLAYYDAQHSADRARLNVLRQTGTLLSALR